MRLGLALAVTVLVAGCSDGKQAATPEVRGSLAEMAADAGFGLRRAASFTESKGESLARKVVLTREGGPGLSIAEARVVKTADGGERLVLRGVVPFPVPPNPVPLDVVAETDASWSFRSLLVVSSPAAKGPDFRISARALEWSAGIPARMDLDFVAHAGGATPMTGASGRINAQAGYDRAARRLSLLPVKASAASGERISGDVVLDDVAPADLTGLARAALYGPGALGAAVARLKASKVDLTAERYVRAPSSADAAHASEEARNGLLNWMMAGQATRRRAESANALMAFFANGTPVRASLSAGAPVALGDAYPAQSAGRLVLEAAPGRKAADATPR